MSDLSNTDLDLLLMRYLECDLLPHEDSQVHTLLDEHTHVRERYCQLAMLASALDEKLSTHSHALATIYPEDTVAPTLGQRVARLSGSDRHHHDPLSGGVTDGVDAIPPSHTNKRIIVIPRPVFWGGIAAAVLLVAGVLFSLIGDRGSARTTVVEQETGVIEVVTAPARLQAATHTQWGAEGLSPSRSGDMRTGRYVLHAGAAEVRLAQGAVMILEAPCTIELLNTNRARLESGRVVAQVPAQASGFTVEAGRVRVVDLGTEFGVEVMESGRVTTVVFDGNVVLGSDREGVAPVSLNAHEMVSANVDGRLGQARPSPLALERYQFARTIELAALTPTQRYEQLVLNEQPLVYWRFDGSEDRIENAAGDRSLDAVRVDQGMLGEGLFGGAAEFAGDRDALGAYATERTMPMGVTDSFSFECWCYIESAHHGTLADLAVLDPNATGQVPHLFAFETIGDDLRGVRQVSPLPQPRVLRLLHRSPPNNSAMRGSNTFSTPPYPTGQWVHLAAVKDGESLFIYVDGELAARGEDAQPAATDPLVYLFVGASAYVSVPGRAQYSTDYRPFHGRVDEVAFYNKALTPDQIRQRVDFVNATLRETRDSSMDSH